MTPNTLETATTLALHTFAGFALPRWLTVHDNAPRATDALATTPAKWNLQTTQQHSTAQYSRHQTTDRQTRRPLATRYCQPTTTATTNTTTNQQFASNRGVVSTGAQTALTADKLSSQQYQKFMFESD
ncbi:GH24065 [Drosophila grimshawi]|uniref:GH24065 n=1 Tax=Drosophila grimshawi TaxID=7222 RepID=B4JNX6_DROGR|nr:GH24065 [Drosophila grimshawi]